ncbi:hypothetical protein COY90_05155 [Candidatus Roizmanbacteria bacterium CG_4_10_14_0_8_um_filter_39_9]|uniref:Type II secretion system protein GspG C-terminal domain-containing protein n=1 Tax=Candidatus Roizmanbacteria bacterium CG_4_10_14_0_8_um_filter_39_9 TaxID=1974829 RepID=A0A2M7QCE2_9BACT|nr:MAG: hypothetical protein COY90_05155 [Candidatus Roizmanbacteria bacterium CG_4_10_14_0_8_um_filter_39_9]
MMKSSSAFTLLEMLIVLGIIAIIISIASVSYSTAQKKSRDARRKSDLKLIQSSFEQYYSLCGYQYPVGSGGAVPTVGCTSPVAIILPTVPVDPRSTPYPMSVSTSSTYTICTTLEVETPASYCLSNQQ